MLPIEPNGNVKVMTIPLKNVLCSDIRTFNGIMGDTKIGIVLNNSNINTIYESVFETVARIDSRVYGINDTSEMDAFRECDCKVSSCEVYVEEICEYITIPSIPCSSYSGNISCIVTIYYNIVDGYMNIYTSTVTETDVLDVLKFEHSYNEDYQTHVDNICSTLSECYDDSIMT